MAKISVIHLASAMAADLKPHNVAALAVTPGFLRSEEMLDHFGVTEENWRDAVNGGLPHSEHFGESETPYLLAQGVAALAADPQVMELTGKALASWDLSVKYGYTDIDGRSPHWGNYARMHGFLPADRKLAVLPEKKRRAAEGLSFFVCSKIRVYECCTL